MPSPLLLLPLLCAVQASPLARRSGESVSGASTTPFVVGHSVSDVYPPTGTQVDTTRFPSESVVGYVGPTPTGAEPFAIATAAAYPTHGDVYPLSPGSALAGSANSSSSSSTSSSSPFEIAKYWGNLSPQFSVPSSYYGLSTATPLIPSNCSLTQIHLYFRHGARYPTTGAPPSLFAEKLQNASSSGQWKAAKGDLEFLNDWTYKLGAELLTPFGRKQNFDFGVLARQMYGHLLNNFTETGTLPVFRTQSQDRMVATMHNFAAGFFGVPSYLTEVSISLQVEAKGLNASGAPYDACPNSNNARGSVGSLAATKFVQPWFNKTAERFSSSIEGNVTLDHSDVVAMMQLCSYETDALGYSKFCGLFTEEEFRVYEQYYDIAFMGNNFYGSPVSAAQGKAYVQELVSRLTQVPLNSTANSAANITLDGDAATFPLNQSIYADAAHEVSILDALSAMGLYSLFNGTLPSSTTLASPSSSNSSIFSASRVVPFGTQVQVQVMQCGQAAEKMARVMVNDAVVPLTYEGCDRAQKDGLCPFEAFVGGLQKRLEEIDFEEACYGNYTVPVYGQITNGFPPSSNSTV